MKSIQHLVNLRQAKHEQAKKNEMKKHSVIIARNHTIINMPFTRAALQHYSIKSTEIFSENSLEA